jgi:hypothetical protein
MAEALFEKAPEEGEMILVPLDRAAHSTARTLAVHWSRLLGCAVRVATVEDREFHSPEDKVTFFLATRQPDFETLSPLLRDDSFPFLYCGPDFGGDPAWAREPSLGLCRIRSKYRPCAEEALYAGLFLLFIEAWKRVHPDRSETAERTFRYCGDAIHAILNSDALLEETARAVHENRAYETAFFIGPPGETGTSWVHRFDGIPSPVMVSYLFGESVHGPLVTVDSRVREKFVRIEARARMEEDHGEGVVAGWESGYLGGRSVDDFLADPPRDVPLHPKSPFYAEGNWFLPVLRPGYDTGNDNLIIMDATSDRFLGHILDEMATYGCRHARIILITQHALASRPERKALYRYPVGHAIHLPSLSIGGHERPVPDLALPLALNLLCSGMVSFFRSSGADTPSASHPHTRRPS